MVSIRNIATIHSQTDNIMNKNAWPLFRVFPDRIVNMMTTDDASILNMMNRAAVSMIVANLLSKTQPEVSTSLYHTLTTVTRVLLNQEMTISCIIDFVTKLPLIIRSKTCQCSLLPTA